MCNVIFSLVDLKSKIIPQDAQIFPYEDTKMRY